MKSIAFIFCLAATSFCTPAQAQALRCNNDSAESI